MDSREGNKLKTNLKAPSVRNEESNHDANYIPGFNNNLPSSTGPESSISKSQSGSPSAWRSYIPRPKNVSSISNSRSWSFSGCIPQPKAVPAISNFRSGSPSTSRSYIPQPKTVFPKSNSRRWSFSGYIPQPKAFSSNSNNPTKSTKQTNETTTEHKLKSLRSSSTGGQKSDESQNKNFDRRTHHESQPFNSTEKNSSTPGDEHPHEAEIRSELNHLTSKFADCQVNLEEVGSFGGSGKSSLHPLFTVIRVLSNLNSERHQVESEIHYQNYISRNNYPPPVPFKRGIWILITDLKKMLSTEISLCLQFISDYKNYLDVEGEQCTVNLLKEMARYNEELSAFENPRIFQNQGDHNQQLDRLLSEITSSLALCVQMFCLIKYCNVLGCRRLLNAHYLSSFKE